VPVEADGFHCLHAGETGKTSGQPNTEELTAQASQHIVVNLRLSGARAAAATRQLQGGREVGMLE
jgi:hypothetical protein